MGGVFCAVFTRDHVLVERWEIFQATLVGEACILERINVDNAPVLRLIRVDSTHPFNPIQPSAQSFPPRLSSESPKTPQHPPHTPQPPLSLAPSKSPRKRSLGTSSTSTSTSRQSTITQPPPPNESNPIQALQPTKRARTTREIIVNERDAAHPPSPFPLPPRPPSLSILPHPPFLPPTSSPQPATQPSKNFSTASLRG